MLSAELGKLVETLEALYVVGRDGTARSSVDMGFGNFLAVAPAVPALSVANAYSRVGKTSGELYFGELPFSEGTVRLSSSSVPVSLHYFYGSCCCHRFFLCID